jgi:hypothetical protein
VGTSLTEGADREPGGYLLLGLLAVPVAPSVSAAVYVGTTLKEGDVVSNYTDSQKAALATM